MSLNKAINHNKEWRKPYRGSKAIDKTCRNHGTDPWSRDNRLYNRKRAEIAREKEIKEYEYEGEGE